MTTPIPPFFLVAVYIFLSLSLSLSVITGKITSLTAGPRGSATLNVSVIKAYKPGRLNMAKSGPATSVTLTSTCKRCPGLTKGTTHTGYLGLGIKRFTQLKKRDASSTEMHKKSVYLIFDHLKRYRGNMKLRKSFFLTTLNHDALRRGLFC